MAKTKPEPSDIGFTCNLSRIKRARVCKPVSSFQSDAAEVYLENAENGTTHFTTITANGRLNKGGSSKNNTSIDTATTYEPSIEQYEASDFNGRVIICPFNCVCCINYQLGKSCSCYAQRETVSVQTNELDFLRMRSETAEYFTRGSLAHSVMQKYINDSIERYELKSKKDMLFGRAVIDVVNSFPDLDCSTDTKNQVSNRMAKAIRWRKFSLKRKQKTASNAMINQEQESQTKRKQRSVNNVIVKKEQPTHVIPNLELKGKRKERASSNEKVKKTNNLQGKRKTNSASNRKVKKETDLQGKGHRTRSVLGSASSDNGGVLSTSSERQNKAKHSKNKRQRKRETQ